MRGAERCCRRGCPSRIAKRGDVSGYSLFDAHIVGPEFRQQILADEALAAKERDS